MSSRATALRSVEEAPDDPPGAARAPGAGAVSLRDVEVRYGRRTAIAALDLDVAIGEVYALLGRNGAGKSSLLRVLLGQQRPAGGTATVLGRDPWRQRCELMAEIGFVPEEPQAPPEMTPRRLLEFCGRVRERSDAAGALDRLQRFGVPVDQPFGRLSKGQRKQVELTVALAHRPTLLVLDDPSLGLDPIARRALFGELIAELAESSITVLLATHDLEAVEGVADRVGVLAGGRLLLDESVETLKARFRRLRMSAGREPDLAMLQPVKREERAWGVEVVVSRWDEKDAAGMEGRTMTLEEIFAVLHEDVDRGARR